MASGGLQVQDVLRCFATDGPNAGHRVPLVSRVKENMPVSYVNSREGLQHEVCGKAGMEVVDEEERMGDMIRGRQEVP